MNNSGSPSRPGLLCVLGISLSPFSLIFSPGSAAQTPANATAAKHDYSAEAFVVEDQLTRMMFENSGNYRRECSARLRIQSGAGVQRFSVLTFPYQGSGETLEIQYVRVRKPNGTVVTTPADTYQDMPSEISRQAPFYSDLREKHVAVKGLVVSDVVEMNYVLRSTKPLIPGQFWTGYNFDHESIVLQERLEIVVPRSRAVKWKSNDMKPNITDEGETRTFTWSSAHTEHPSGEEERKEKERAAYDVAQGKNVPADVQLSSFQSWEEIGRWYQALQQERASSTPEVRAKAEELTKGLTDQTAKMRAVYEFVSTQFRYIGVAFGIGRYQPHFSNEVLSNQYGDCKDKHTLLASLLNAIGVKAYPALISSSHEIDPDVPSPAQFDHVITAIPMGDHFLWLDTTPELSPFGYLIGVLRDKKALVITEGNAPALVNTPAAPPTKGSQNFRIDAKLSDKGILEGKVQRSLDGDDAALIIRTAFRSLPMPQWKDLVQRMSLASGFSGEISDATASSPEKTDEPFRVNYTYTRKDFGDWPNRRIVAPLPALGLPLPEDKIDKLSFPIWLGGPLTVHCESYLELPKGYTPDVPVGVDAKENFADYHASYHFKDGVLISERDLVIKSRELPVAEYDAYKKFTKIVNDDYGLFIALSSRNVSITARLNPLWSLPPSQNPDAVDAYNQAVSAFQRRDLQEGIDTLKHAVELDPKFARAWVTLAQAYAASGDSKQALNSFQKAIKEAPQESTLYDGLGFLLRTYTPEESIGAWQDVVKANPENPKAWAGLGSALLRSRKYKEAAVALQSAADHNPEIAEVQAQLGSAYLHLGEKEKALKAYGTAVDLDLGANMLNDVSYELADANEDLPEALQYAKKAVLLEEEASQDIEPTDIQQEDLAHPGSLSAYWDTLGWVHFRMGNFAEAEKYLESAWKLGQSAFIAEHLAQVLEHDNKKQRAAHMYQIALYLYKSSGLRDDAEVVRTEDRLERLTPGKSNTDRYNFNKISDEVNRTRTVQLGRLANDATAEFFLIFERDPETSAAKVEGVRFIKGSEELKSADKALTSAKFDLPFPDDGPTRLLRRGILSCYKSAGCSFTLVNVGDVHSLN
jgi:tetratricopeptide (TPR) repeat protein